MQPSPAWSLARCVLSGINLEKCFLSSRLDSYFRTNQDQMSMLSLPVLYGERHPTSPAVSSSVCSFWQLTPWYFSFKHILRSGFWLGGKSRRVQAAWLCSAVSCDCRPHPKVACDSTCFLTHSPDSLLFCTIPGFLGSPITCGFQQEASQFCFLLNTFILLNTLLSECV